MSLSLPRIFFALSALALIDLPSAYALDPAAQGQSNQPGAERERQERAAREKQELENRARQAQEAQRRQEEERRARTEAGQRKMRERNDRALPETGAEEERRRREAEERARRERDEQDRSLSQSGRHDDAGAIVVAPIVPEGAPADGRACSGGIVTFRGDCAGQTFVHLCYGDGPDPRANQFSLTPGEAHTVSTPPGSSFKIQCDAPPVDSCPAANCVN